MTTMQVTGVLECPHCGAQWEYSFPANTERRIEQRTECPDCGKDLVISAKVDVEIRKAKA